MKIAGIFFFGGGGGRVFFFGGGILLGESRLSKARADDEILVK